jgi:hypothetical protein
MIIVILGGCLIGGLAIYFLIVRPLVMPLTQRIPTGKAYRPSLGGKS